MTAEARSVVVRLSMEAAQYIRDAQKVGTVTADAMSKVEKSTDKASQALDGLGAKGGRAALAAGGGLVAMGKAAVDWQSQWAGVTKTVDGTTSQMAQLEDGLRGLATTLPATHQEIAGVAEAAGQLGVAREDILDFTETMVALGETTNLTAQDAATNIAQIANVMGTTGDEVDNLGAALVALGNDGASTEKQILDMTQRIAGAGAQIGLAESEILAIANAAASMGIEAEAGGSAISRVFTELAKATSQGGPQLEAFAAVANTSAQEFARAFETDPARAFASFTQGLDRINKSGGDVFTTLDDLGLADVRVSQALLGMAASGDLLTDSLNLGAKAWEENTALTDEAAKRYDTTASKVQVAWNKIKDAAIEGGSVILPILAEGAELVGVFADAFGALPDPVQNTITGLLGITAVLGGGLWFTSKVIGGITSTRAELRLLAAEGTRTAAALNATTGALGRMSKLKGAAILGGLAVASTGAADSIGLTNTASLALMGTIGGPWGAAVGGATGLVLDFADAQEILAKATNDTNRAIASQDVGQLEAQLRDLDEAARELQDVDFGLFANGVKSTFSSLLSGDDPRGGLDKQIAQLEGEAGKIRDAMLELQTSATQDISAELVLGPMGAIGQAADVAAASVEDLSKEFEHLNAVLSGRASWRDYEAAIDAVTESLKENGRTLDRGTAAGRENQEALDSIASTAVKVAENLTGIDRVKYLERARGDFLDAAAKLGMGSVAAKKLADDLFGVGQIKAKPEVDVKDDKAKDKLRDLDAALFGLNAARPRPVVDVQTAASEARLRNLLAQMANVRDKEVFIRLRTIGPGRKMGGDVAGAISARGNFLPAHAMAYAGGGIDRANAHRPEIADGRMIRIWNEPETGGESYIPHANDSRRPRAKNILEQTANLFGGTVNWYAGGGISAPVAPTSVTRTVVASPGQLVVSGVLDTPWGPARVEGIAAAAARREIDADREFDRSINRG